MNSLVRALLALFGFRPNLSDVVLDTEERAFFELLNQHRVDNDLQPLRIDPNLTLSCAMKARYMATHDQFAHTLPGETDSPDDDIDPWEAIGTAGYNYNAYKGENIAKFFWTGVEVFNGWKNSPGHNSNMLGERYKSTGIARHMGERGWFWVSVFGGV